MNQLTICSFSVFIINFFLIKNYLWLNNLIYLTAFTLSESQVGWDALCEQLWFWNLKVFWSLPLLPEPPQGSGCARARTSNPPLLCDSVGKGILPGDGGAVFRQCFQSSRFVREKSIWVFFYSKYKMKCMETKQMNFTWVFLMLKHCCVLKSAGGNNAGSRQFPSNVLKKHCKTTVFVFYTWALKKRTFCYPETVIKMFSQ